MAKFNIIYRIRKGEQTEVVGVDTLDVLKRLDMLVFKGVTSYPQKGVQYFNYDVRV